MQTQGVILYRSQLEAQADQFWASHPEIFVYATYVVIAVLVCVGVYKLGNHLYNRFRGKKYNRMGRWS